MTTDAAGLDPLRGRLIGFIREIGIAVHDAAPDESGFLPGLDIRRGAIVINHPRWLHPGDILHEAGHLAVAAPAARSAERLSPDGGDEMTAIAWSYAAAVHLGQPAAIVFHAAGYRGGAESLIENFEGGRRAASAFQTAVIAARMLDDFATLSLPVTHNPIVIPP